MGSAPVLTCRRPHPCQDCRTPPQAHRLHAPLLIHQGWQGGNPRSFQDPVKQRGPSLRISPNCCLKISSLNKSFGDHKKTSYCSCKSQSACLECMHMTETHMRSKELSTGQIWKISSTQSQVRRGGRPADGITCEDFESIHISRPMSRIVSH